MRGAGPVAAALTARVVGEHLVDADPPPHERRVLAVRGHEDVVGPHRARDPDRHRLLPVRGGVGPEPALTVQGDAFRIEGAGQHHRAVERDDRLRGRQRFGQRVYEHAVLVEVAPQTDLEAGDDGEARGGVKRHRSILGAECTAGVRRARRRRLAWRPVPIRRWACSVWSQPASVHPLVAYVRQGYRTPGCGSRLGADFCARCKDGAERLIRLAPGPQPRRRGSVMIRLRCTPGDRT